MIEVASFIGADSPIRSDQISPARSIGSNGNFGSVGMPTY